MAKIIIILFFAFCFCDEVIITDVPSLITEHKYSDLKSTTLYGYSHHGNDGYSKCSDDICETQCKKLEWFSDGDLTIIKDKKGIVFHIYSDKVTIRIKMLSEEHKNSLAKFAKMKYGCDSISIDQIHQIELKYFKASVSFTHNGKKYIYVGDASNLANSPLSVEFPMDENAINILKNDKNIYATIRCEYGFGTTSLQQLNYLDIGVLDNQLDYLSDQLFGSNKDEVLLTRNQLALLAKYKN